MGDPQDTQETPMSAPLTQTQIPNDSILDINGRQTYLGNSFTLPATGTSLANTVETPICVLKNPAGSGKSLFLFNGKVSTDLNPLILRYYKNPVLNVPGSTTVPLNLRTGATTTSISLCYLGATITSNGTLLALVQATTSGNSIIGLTIIDPGTSILITAQQAAVGTSIAVAQNAWYEI